MRALTVHQPWASLIACGAKRYETRSRRCDLHTIGPELAIHAGKRLALPYELTPRESDAIALALLKHGLKWGDVPLSAVLCIVRVISIESTQGKPPKTEAQLGDWSRGCYAWRLEVLEVFDPPIPARGMQGLWEWERP